MTNADKQASSWKNRRRAYSMKPEVVKLRVECICRRLKLVDVGQVLPLISLVIEPAESISELHDYICTRSAQGRRSL